MFLRFPIFRTDKSPWSSQVFQVEWEPWFCPIFIARKRGLGQCNVVTPVCHSVHRGVGFPASITGHKTSIGGRGLHPGREGVCIKRGRGSVSMEGGRSASRGRWVCIQGGRGSASGRGQGGLHPGGSALVGGQTPIPHLILRHSQWTGGTHPTGMHSCWHFKLLPMSAGGGRGVTGGRMGWGGKGLAFLK